MLFKHGNQNILDSIELIIPLIIPNFALDHSKLFLFNFNISNATQRRSRSSPGPPRPSGSSECSQLSALIANIILGCNHQCRYHNGNTPAFQQAGSSHCASAAWITTNAAMAERQQLGNSQVATAVPRRWPLCHSRCQCYSPSFLPVY